MDKQNTHKTHQPVPQARQKHPDQEDNRPSPPMGMILQLQRTVGNQAVMRMLDDNVVLEHPGPTITASGDAIQRRRSRTGLGATGLINDFAGEALTYWRDAGNAARSLNDFGDHLMANVNAKLAVLGVPNVNHAYVGAGSSRGTFDRTTWTVELNTGQFSEDGTATTVSDLEQGEVSQIARTLYHEPRHAEQYFRIARMQAGEGKSADDIETDMDIPADIAAAAFASPLTGDNRANRRLIQEARIWEAFTVGKYAEYKGETNWLDDQADEMVDIVRDYDPDDPDTTYDDLEDYVDEVEDSINDVLDPILTQIGTIRRKDSADRNVRRNIRKMKRTFLAFKAEYDRDPRRINKITSKLRKFSDATYKAYTEFEHERDTRSIHNAVISSFNRQARRRR